MPRTAHDARPLPPGAGAFAPTQAPAQADPLRPARPAYAPPPPVNGLAVASLVLGILGLCSYGTAGVLALVFGLIAQHQIKNKGQSGQGLAVAGIVLGSISIAFGLFFLSFFILGWFA